MAQQANFEVWAILKQQEREMRGSEGQEQV